ncbi:hypothetical protein FACS1894180_0480 [Bacteroidia bacterium]|nr:hypothetical protein FACS1894180_0480 [Bacteroidia bacterium]
MSQVNLVQTSFEDYNLGNLAGQQSWTVSSGNATVSNSGDYVHSGDKGVVISATSGMQVDNVSFSSSQTGLDGLIYIDFWVKITALPSTHTAITGYDLTSNSRNIMVEFRTDYKLKVYDGSGGASAITPTYQLNQWYRLSFLVNNYTKTYRFSLNGNVYSADLGFREIKAAATTLDYHSLRFNQSSGTANFAIDDMYVGSNSISDIDFGGGTDTTVVPPDTTVINPPTDTLDCTQEGITRTVSNYALLKTALQAMNPGDIIILEDGTYSGSAITVTRSGCETRPIVIKARNKGQALIRGNLYFTLRDVAFVTFEGLDFDISHQSVIFKMEGCNNVRITENHFKMQLDPNDSTATSKWILIGDTWNDLTCNSHHNRIDHNFFDGKYDGGAWLVIDGSHGTSPGFASQHDRIDHNHFLNNTPRVTNEKETIRIGVSDLSFSSSFTTVEYNYFENCDGDPEIISVKACDNIVRGNTFFNCLGTVCLRHGFRNTVDGNYFKSDGKIIDGNGCGGVRIYGKDHKVVNNYFENLTGQKWDACLTITNGDVLNTSTSYSSHFIPENLIAAHNTMVNNQSDIEIGFTNNGNYNKAPVNCLIADNISINNQNPIVKVWTNLNGITFNNNIFYPTGNASIGTTLTSVQAQQINPLLENSNCLANDADCYHLLPTAVYKLKNGSPAINIGTNNYVLSDFEGQIRDANPDLGADEYSIDSISYGYLSPNYVGINAQDFLLFASSDNKNINSNEYISIYVFDNNLNFIFENSRFGTAVVNIYNIQGKLLKSENITTYQGLNQGKINITNLKTGLYILQIGNITAKFVKN